MGKYSFEFKSTIVQEYLEGEGGLGYLAKIQGVRSKKVHGWINQKLDQKSNFLGSLFVWQNILLN
ncbi:transposase [Enterococcus faecium]|nr:transposase [Enterococcus faecium]